MIKNPQNHSFESRIFHSSPRRLQWDALTDGSAFSNQLARVISSAQARELREELKSLDTEPDHIWRKALDRAWDCWCNFTGMDEWNQPGILAHRNSLQVPRDLTMLCRLDRLDRRDAFPKMELRWLKPEKADVRFVMAAGQSLKQARTWQVEFTRLESIADWPEMLLKLIHEELRKARIEINAAKQKRLEKQQAFDTWINAWSEATWNLLTRGDWSSLQGDELHIGSTAIEVMKSRNGCEKAPFWEWSHRTRPTIILAIRFIQASKSGKRWLIEGRMVSSDIFSSPQGQTAFTTWKRTLDIKKHLHLHLASSHH